MNTLYGTIKDDTLEKYKDKLHSKIFWLLLYKDPKTKDEFTYVDYDKYFVGLMKELTGFADILQDPSQMVELLSVLQAAYNESKQTPFDYKEYRKFVLDAHAILDRMEVDNHDNKG